MIKMKNKITLNDSKNDVLNFTTPTKWKKQIKKELSKNLPKLTNHLIVEDSIKDALKYTTQTNWKKKK